MYQFITVQIPPPVDNFGGNKGAMEDLENSFKIFFVKDFPYKSSPEIFFGKKSILMILLIIGNIYGKETCTAL